jgi:hypothetical protein
MILSSIAIALLVQAVPGSISGTVVQSGTGAPLANVRVTLAQTDAQLGAFAQMVSGRNTPPVEITVSGETLAAMGQISAARNSQDAKGFAALPVADIAELTVSPNGEISVVYKSALPALTDAQGHFAFNDVRPGTYKLKFASNGYALQTYGQRSSAGTGLPIAVASGQSHADIVIRMSQVGAVGGRVANTEGHPVAGVPVQLLHFAYDETGNRTVQRITAAKTDDRGQFRMFNLSPGRYYLNAGNPVGPDNELDRRLNSDIGVTTSPINRIPEQYAQSYYPGTPEVRAATPIDVAPGTEVTGIDMVLRPQQVFRVKGFVIDPRSGQTPRNVLFTLRLPNGDPFLIDNGQSFYNSADGTFELRNIAPGAYIVSALSLDPQPGQTGRGGPPAGGTAPAENSGPPRAFARLTVANSDIAGLQLRVASAMAVAGAIRMDPAVNVPAPDFTFLRVILRPVAGSSSATNQKTQTASPDGTFRINDLWPGDYQVLMTGLPAGFYLKEVRLGELDLTNNSWRYNGSDAGAMTIVISPNTGTLDGVVSDAQGRSVAGARVVLIPERNRERTDLFRPAVTDPNGHFTLAGVTPGDYRLAAWESIEPFAFFDPDLLKQADDAAKPVRIMESSKQTINVTAFR